MKIQVVPELSERWTTLILASESLTPGFRSAIALSFQTVMSPLKMWASVSASRRISSAATPSRLMTGTTPPTHIGYWASPDSSSSACSSGASEAPKSTVLALMAEMPPPEPMDW